MTVVYYASYQRNQLDYVLCEDGIFRTWPTPGVQKFAEPNDAYSMVENMREVTLIDDHYNEVSVIVKRDIGYFIVKSGRVKS